MRSNADSDLPAPLSQEELANGRGTGVMDVAWKRKTLITKITKGVQSLDCKKAPWAGQTPSGTGAQGPVRKVNSEHDLVRKNPEPREKENCELDHSSVSIILTPLCPLFPP